MQEVARERNETFRRTSRTCSKRGIKRWLEDVSSGHNLHWYNRDEGCRHKDEECVTVKELEEGEQKK